MKQHHFNTRRWQHRSHLLFSELIWSAYLFGLTIDRRGWSQMRIMTANPSFTCVLFNGTTTNLLTAMAVATVAKVNPVTWTHHTGMIFRKKIERKNSAYVNAKMWSHPSRIDGNCEHISKLNQKSTSCRQELEYPGHPPMVQCISMLIHVRTLGMWVSKG